MTGDCPVSGRATFWTAPPMSKNVTCRLFHTVQTLNGGSVHRRGQAVLTGYWRVYPYPFDVAPDAQIPPKTQFNSIKASGARLTFTTMGLS
jgi:hypothetical protein